MKTKQVTVLSLVVCAVAISCASEDPGGGNAPSTGDQKPAPNNAPDRVEGSALDRVQTEFRREPRSARHSGVALIAALQTKRLKQDETADRALSATWKEDKDGSHRILTRSFPAADGSGELTQFRELDYYQSRKSTLTDQGVKEAATAIVTEVMAQEGTLGPGEQFLPESTRIKNFRSFSVETKKELNLVVAARVTLRRHIDSVPVLEADGAASVVFDAAGDVIELDFPTNAYTRGAALKNWQPGAAMLKNAFNKAGYSEIPIVGRTVKLQNLELTVASMQCGLREVETSDTLERGCQVAALNATSSPRLEFVPAGD